MKRSLAAWLLLPGLLLAACDSEESVGIGHELLPDDVVQSFEVTLDPAQYLLRDTSFALYSQVEDADFSLLARGYGGAVTANVFARFNIPSVIGVTDSLGIARTDSAPTYVRGEILLVADSMVTVTTDPLRIALHSFAEEWDPTVADWNFRKEGVRWTTAGGTLGAQHSTTVYSRTDTMRLAVDSATLALWRDTLNQRRGAHLSLLDAPARVRTTEPRLKLFARSRFKRDTLFTVFAQAPSTRFVYEPAPDTIAGDLRFNGTPGWRAFLQLRPDLRNLLVPCGPGCTVALNKVDITRAELLLQPLAPRSGFEPELDTNPIPVPALVSPHIPITRTPLGSLVDQQSGTVSRTVFRDGGPIVRVQVTNFIRQVVLDTTTTGESARTEWLAISGSAVRTFGYGRFAAGPRLRLVISSAKELQLQ